MPETSLRPLRIGTLARQAGVGVETIRYYQRRKLLGTPARPLGGQRGYPPDYVERLLFIRRAQALGFSLDDVATLLTLSDGVDHVRARAIAQRRLEDVSSRIADLERIRAVLEKLMRDCELAAGCVPCPIISAIRGRGKAAHRPGEAQAAARRSRANRMAEA